MWGKGWGKRKRQGHKEALPNAAGVFPGWGKLGSKKLNSFFFSFDPSGFFVYAFLFCLLISPFKGKTRRQKGGSPFPFRKGRP